MLHPLQCIVHASYVLVAYGYLRKGCLLSKFTIESVFSEVGSKLILKELTSQVLKQRCHAVALLAFIGIDYSSFIHV